jgi:hypothetical protein
VVLSDEGRPLADSLNPRAITAKVGWVHYRLATARYVGKQARIYYVIPPNIPGLRSPAGLQISWTTNGPWASGTARPGERRLVWAGTVRDPWVQAEFDITLGASLRDLQLPADGRLGFEPYFEIEASP